MKRYDYQVSGGSYYSDVEMVECNDGNYYAADEVDSVLLSVEALLRKAAWALFRNDIDIRADVQRQISEYLCGKEG